MKRHIHTVVAALMTLLPASSLFADTPLPTEESHFTLSIPLLDKAVFYDGYQSKIIDEEVNDGILRHSNSLYAVRLYDEQLDMIGSRAGLGITIGALCDNYDRIGSAYIAFVPKGSDSYKFEDVERIEIARFITPFMNKNVAPTEVPFDYSLPGLELILADHSLREVYDLWFEFDVFGVPYAANTSIRGCEGRNDVFAASATLLTDELPATPTEGHILIPIYTRKQELHGNVNLNNYKEQATDTLGTTTRTFEFELPHDVEDSKITFILTNHGAAKGGEEYVRRLHLIYFDDDLSMAYTPGGISCEPYRKYNTCFNGIYQMGYMPDEYWQTVSNWCPGQAVPVREIHTGPLEAGIHKFMIRVPDAEFVGQDGDFRPSIYFQGVKKGEIALGVSGVVNEQENVTSIGADISLKLDGTTLLIGGMDEVARISVFSLDGQLLYGKSNPRSSLDLQMLGEGVYVIVAETPDGRTAFAKFFLH